MKETLCIPIFNERVAPLFDVSGQMLIVQCASGKEINRFVFPVSTENGYERIKQLGEINVSCVICSAISRACAIALAHSGINLIPGIIGSVEEILKAYQNGDLKLERFFMPGCRGAKMRGRCGMGRKNRARVLRELYQGGDFYENSDNS